MEIQRDALDLQALQLSFGSMRVCESEILVGRKMQRKDTIHLFPWELGCLHVAVDLKKAY